MQSKIQVSEPNPDWMREPSKPYEPTPEQLKDGMKNTESLKLIANKNNQIWQQDRDNLRGLQSYTRKLLLTIRKEQ